MLKIVALLWLVGVLSADQFVPVPSHPFGIPLSQDSAKPAEVDFEVFLDLLCSDSKAFLPEWEKFLDYEYKGAKVSERVSVLYHLETLPYHHNSFFTHKLADYIQVNHGNKVTLDYMHAIYKGQEQFLSGAVDLSENDVIAKIIKYSAEELGLAEDDLEKAWDGYDYEMGARYRWKYAISRAVTGTPAIAVNGVLSQDVPMTVEDLKTAFLPYLD